MEGIMINFANLTDEQRIERYEKLARKALAAYGMADSILTFRSYTENAVYEVEQAATSTHASLRICRQAWEADALTREACWLTSLAQNTDLRIPEPIPTLTDEPYCVVEMDGIPGVRACMLFTWVTGAYANTDELTPARMGQAGRFLATLHNHAETFQPPIAMTRFDADAIEAADCRANVSTYFSDESELRWFDYAIGETVRLMRSLGDHAAVAGLIHGDFHQRNYIFDGSQIGALDFETMQWGYYLYDLATTLSYLVPEFLGDVDPEPLRKAILEAYAAQRGVPDGIERVLKIFSAYRVWIMADWVSGSPRMLEHDWARRRLDEMPSQITELLEGG